MKKVGRSTERVHSVCLKAGVAQRAEHANVRARQALKCKEGYAGGVVSVVMWFIVATTRQTCGPPCARRSGSAAPEGYRNNLFT